MAVEAPAAYPVRIDVAPPARQSRLSVFFRYFLAIPHIIVLSLVMFAAEVVLFISWWVILFTGTYPVGMLKFSIGALRWNTLLGGYISLLTDKYPPFSLEDGEYPIRFLSEERVEGRNRFTTFWLIRFALAIPHFFVLMVLSIALVFVWIVAWFAALFTASVPAGMHNFMEGVLRWGGRVNAYLFNLVDEYPPFSMK